MGDDLTTRGRHLRQRRLHHDIRTAVELAALAGMDRRTVAAAEAGEASATSIEALEVFFDRLDAEKNTDSRPGSDVSTAEIEFDVTGPRTEWHITVRGPADRAEELRHQVVELARELESGD